MKRSACIFGLDAFGLNESALHRLGARPVTVEVTVGIPPYIYPSRSKLRHLLQITPSKRRALVHQWRRRKYTALRKALAVKSLDVIKLNMTPAGVRLTLPAKSIERLCRIRKIGVIRICSVEGIREKNLTQVKSRLYGVTGSMVFQVEGQTRGTQLCEERITIVPACSERDACARVGRIMRAESHPYLLESGHFGRWSFEGVTDVCECPDEEFSSKSMEVFYRYKKRRVNIKNEWHPSAHK